MEQHYINQFLDKLVLIHINGFEMRGIISRQNDNLTLSENENVVFLKQTDFLNKLYGVSYINTDSIDTICEILPQETQSFPPLTQTQIEEERVKIREEMLAEIENKAGFDLGTKEGRQQYRQELITKLANDEQGPHLKQEINQTNVEYTQEFADLLKDMPKTNILIYLQDKIIGAVQSMEIHETRTDQDAPVDISLEAYRIRFSRDQIAEIFERSIVSSTTQKHPLQIIIKENNCEVTRIHNAWIVPFHKMYVYTSTDWVIADEMHFKAESISSPQHFSTNDLLPINGRGL